MKYSILITLFTLNAYMFNNEYISADSVIVEIKTSGIDLSYDITELKVKSGSNLTIRYDNTESDMVHNIVVLQSVDDINPVGMASLQAYQNEYIPEEKMDRIIAYSKLAFPGDIVEITFVVPPPGIYPYICTYSGHFTTMQGRLISIE